MIGRQATVSVRCASSQHTLSPSEQGSSHSSGSSRLDRNGALGPATHIGVHYIFGRIKFVAPATEVRLLRNIPTSVTLLTDLRRRGTSTELLSECEVTFRLRRNRQGESVHMTMRAWDVLTDRWENRLAVSRIVYVLCCLFLVSELGDDIGRTCPRDTRSSVPEIELSVGTVHVASFAFQAIVATNAVDLVPSDFAEPVRPPAFQWQTLCTFPQLPPRVRVRRCRLLHHV